MRKPEKKVCLAWYRSPEMFGSAITFTASPVFRWSAISQVPVSYLLVLACAEHFSMLFFLRLAVTWASVSERIFWRQKKKSEWQYPRVSLRTKRNSTMHENYCWRFQNALSGRSAWQIACDSWTWLKFILVLKKTKIFAFSLSVPYVNTLAILIPHMKFNQVFWHKLFS